MFPLLDIFLRPFVLGVHSSKSTYWISCTMRALWESCAHLPFKVIQASNGIRQRKTLLKLTKMFRLSSVPCYGWGKASSIACKHRIQPACQNLPLSWTHSSTMIWLPGLCKQRLTDLEIKISFARGWSLFVEWERCEGVFSEVHRMVEFHMCTCGFWANWQPGWSRSTIHHCCELSWYPTEPVSFAKTAGWHHTSVGNQYQNQ